MPAMATVERGATPIENRRAAAGKGVDVYLPTLCIECDEVALVPAPCGSGFVCRMCGGQARAIPGQAYRAEDCPLFDQVEAAVGANATAQAELSRLVAQLSNVTERTGAPELVLSQILHLMPSLEFLKPRSPAESARLVHALGMLLAIVTARLRVVAVGTSLLELNPESRSGVRPGPGS